MMQGKKENSCHVNLRDQFEIAAVPSEPPVKAKRQGLKRSAPEGDPTEFQEPAPKRSRISSWLGMAINAGRSVLRMATNFRSAHGSAPSASEVPMAEASQPERSQFQAKRRQLGHCGPHGGASQAGVTVVPKCKTERTIGCIDNSRRGGDFDSLLHVEPQHKVVFPRIAAGEAAITLRIRNVSSGLVAFKIKATSLSCQASPFHGLISPSEQQEVRLTLTQAGLASANTRYLVQAVAVLNGEPDWKTLTKSAIMERQLAVDFAKLGALIQTEPAGELCFIRDRAPEGALISTLKLVNVSTTNVAYKMKANISDCLEVCPNSGTIAPNQQVQIQCRLLKEGQWDRLPTFMLQAAAVETAAPVTFNQFSTFHKEWMQECRWKAVMKR
mmetsp:Transcript_152144/g.283475  ORF Transcript_152144/g.283475 Transcript_152144/m.283475 type:complete len:385 (+) Transcript_152144:106-1260(+)